MHTVAAPSVAAAAAIATAGPPCRKAAWRRAHAHEDPLTLLRQDVRSDGAATQATANGGPVEMSLWRTGHADH